MPRQFPHLLPDDAALWQRFLDSPQNTWQFYEYDVRVGLGRDPGNTVSPEIRNMAIDLSQRRIDAVALAPDSYTVIEISTNAGLTQIGQLIAYPHLLRQSYGITLPIHSLLVAENIQSDIIPVLDLIKIPYITLQKGT